MSDISIDDFASSLRKSHAIDSATAESKLADLSQFPSPKHLARSLVADGLLTEWQAKFLLSGRHRLKIGNYLLLNRIQRDEFGDRFQALHTSLDRKVVMHIFSKDISTDVARRKAVIKKASLVSKLDHPNLVHVYDIDHEGDRYFVIVEHTSGKPVEVGQSMGLSEAEIADLVKQCLTGLFYAHQHDVIHGSIVPGDLILADDGSIKIQNLSMQPLRIETTDQYQPSENDDFVAISNIGLKLLNANKSVEPNPNRQALREIFAKLRKNQEVVAGELDQWIAENPKREVSMAPVVAASPTRPGAHKTRSSGKNKIPQDTTLPEDELKGFAKAWDQNPIGMIAVITVPLVILGVIGLLIVQQLTNPNRTVAQSPDVADHSQTTGSQQPLAKDTAEEADEQPVESAGAESTQTSRARNVDEARNGSDRSQPKSKEPSNAAGKGSKPPSGKPQNKKQPTSANPKPADKSNGKPKQVAKNGPKKQAADAKLTPVKGNDKLMANSPVSTAAAPGANNQPKPPANPPIIPKAEKNEKDDLTKISGIAEATQKKLYAKTITTYGQLAKMKPEHLNKIGKSFSAFGIPLDRAKNIVNQAKALVSASPVASKGAKKAVDPASPYAKVPDRVRLPAPSNEKVSTLTPLVIRKQDLLGLEIISPEGIGRSKISYVLNRKDVGKQQQWIISYKRTPKQAPKPVAKFLRTEKELQFQWLPDASKKREAQWLQNCFIKLFTLSDNESKVVSLRKPIAIPALRLDKDRLAGEISFQIDSMPDLSKVRLEMKPIPRGDSEIDISRPAVTLEENGRIYFRDVRNQERDSLWVDVRAEFKSKIKVIANTIVVNPNAGPVVVKDFSEFEINLNRLKTIQSIAAQQLQAAPTNNDKKTAMNKATDAVKLMQKYLKGLNKLRNGTPINFRVLADFDGYQVVLAYSDPNMATGKKRKKSYSNAAPTDNSKKPAGEKKDQPAPKK